MEILNLTFLFILGFCVGSFLGVVTYRLPRNIPLSGGKFSRSFCPSCKKKIPWFDNIPLLSFLLLGGKCRNCKNKISLKEPVIELVTGIVFVLSAFNTLFPVYIFLIIASILIAIAFIDIENQIIPDELVWLGLSVLIAWYLLADFKLLFPHLLSGLGVALFLLIINLITSGKGMGLGDVKLAILLGAMLDVKFVLVWLLASFVIGAFVGIILIVAGKATLKRKVPFAPFLIIGFFTVAFLGHVLIDFLFPI